MQLAHQKVCSTTAQGCCSAWRWPAGQHNAALTPTCHTPTCHTHRCMQHAKLSQLPPAAPTCSIAIFIQSLSSRHACSITTPQKPAIMIQCADCSHASGRTWSPAVQYAVRELSLTVLHDAVAAAKVRPWVSSR
jgi:hypothetical protein